MRGMLALWRMTVKETCGAAAERASLDTSRHAFAVLRRLYAADAAPTEGAAPQAPAASAASTSVPWSSVPSTARTLGLAGAVPFLALSPPIAAALPMMPADLLASAALLQVGYGASVLSFLGGIHWAMAMAEYGGKAASAEAEPERYIWSVTPCLMAWPAVALPAGPGSLVIAATLGIAYAVDRTFTKKGLLPPWYLKLRGPLTLAAASGMLLTMASTPVVPEPSGGVLAEGRE